MCDHSVGPFNEIIVWILAAVALLAAGFSLSGVNREGTRAERQTDVGSLDAEGAPQG